MFRTTLTRNARLFTTSLPRNKVIPEPVADTVKKADRAVSDTLVKGIEKGEQAADAAKSAAGVKSGEVQGKAAEVAGQAKGKAAEVAGEAKGKKEELKGEVKKNL